MFTLDSPLESRIALITARAEELLGRARELGLVVTIHLEPQKPLAMRSYEPVLAVREFRQ